MLPGGHLEAPTTVTISATATTRAATGIAPSARTRRWARWVQQRQGELSPIHISTWSSTIPSELNDPALHNPTVVYKILLDASARTLQTIAADPKHLGARDRLLLHPAHLGTKPAPEPSLMMPGIIISFIFSEQRRLILRTAPVQH